MTTVPGSMRGPSAVAGATVVDAGDGVAVDDAGADEVDPAGVAFATGAAGAVPADVVAAELPDGRTGAVVDDDDAIVSPRPGPYFMNTHSPAATAMNATPSTTAIVAVCDFATAGADVPGATGGGLALDVP